MTTSEQTYLQTNELSLLRLVDPALLLVGHLLPRQMSRWKWEDDGSRDERMQMRRECHLGHVAAFLERLEGLLYRCIDPLERVLGAGRVLGTLARLALLALGGAATGTMISDTSSGLFKECWDRRCRVFGSCDARCVDARGPSSRER